MWKVCMTKFPEGTSKKFTALLTNLKILPASIE